MTETKEVKRPEGIKKALEVIEKQIEENTQGIVKLQYQNMALWKAHEALSETKE